jgi:hypothetical protein
MAYRHTQIGWAMITILVPIIALLIWVAAATGGAGTSVVAGVIVLLVACLILFISQTVLVDDQRIEVLAGPGFIHRTVSLADIRTVDELHLQWWAVGLGIRMSLDGKRQLWRVSGSDVVDLGLADGRRLLIATDEPEALAAVVRLATGTKG